MNISAALIGATEGSLF